jgi:recombinational DNA repair protein (RecF pathway)
MNETDTYVRQEIEACARCGETEAPYAYLHDGEHYCVRCARVLLVVEKVRPAGRRADDLTLDDVLFLDLPHASDAAPSDAGTEDGGASDGEPVKPATDAAGD